MIFNSLTYFYFLFIVWGIHWLSPVRWRLGILTVASFIFYMSWRWEYGFLLLFCITTNFYLSQVVNKSKVYLWLAIIFNLSLLGFYKYLGFFTEILNGISALFSFPGFLVPQILLPLGISFFTFHSMSYVIDVYRGDRLPEAKLSRLLLYEAFWPHLIAGPILRSHEIIPQFDTPPKISYQDVSEGVKRILEGLFKKVVLADNLAGFINEGFTLSTYANNSALDNWSLAFAFGLQIYFDFSGYSDIAIGSARLFGYQFPENFNFPYLASNPREFWKRWHITLSSWIRDYLYIPLQGGKHQKSTAEGGINVESLKIKSPLQRNVALFSAWGLMGLWHGANWTFIFWGFWHGAYIFLFRVWEDLKRISPFFRFTLMPDFMKYGVGLLMTTVWVMMGWIFFRSQNITQALHILAALFQPVRYRGLNLPANFYILTLAMLLSIYLASIVQKFSQRFRGNSFYNQSVWIFNSLKYSVIIILIIAFLKQGTQFIYFQF